MSMRERDNRLNSEAVTCAWSLRSARAHADVHESRKLVDEEQHETLVGAPVRRFDENHQPVNWPVPSAGTIIQFQPKREWCKKLKCWVLVPVPVVDKKPVRVQVDDAARLLSTKFAVKVGRRA